MADYYVISLTVNSALPVPTDDIIVSVVYRYHHRHHAVERTPWWDVVQCIVQRLVECIAAVLRVNGPVRRRRDKARLKGASGIVSGPPYGAWRASDEMSQARHHRAAHGVVVAGRPEERGSGLDLQTGELAGLRIREIEIITTEMLPAENGGQRGCGEGTRVGW